MTKLLELAEQLAAHPKWGWDAGMQAVHSNGDVCTVVGMDDQGRLLVCELITGAKAESKWAFKFSPNLAHRGTVGAIQGLIEDWCDKRGWTVHWETNFVVTKCWAGPSAELFEESGSPGAIGIAAAQALLWCWKQEENEDE